MRRTRLRAQLSCSIANVHCSVIISVRLDFETGLVFHVHFIHNFCSNSFSLYTAHRSSAPGRTCAGPWELLSSRVRSDDLFSVLGLHVLVPAVMGIQGLATYLREHRQILSRRFELSVISQPKDVTRLVVDGWS